MSNTEKNINWLKGRGYVHITPKLNVKKNGNVYAAKIQNTRFVAKHSFFPLLHYIIKERKYKKHPDDCKRRVHSYKKDGLYHQTAKQRPIHYATHIDALIFGYYAELLNNKYKAILESNPVLKEAITAYRKIPLNDTAESKGKSTIHFANEAFKEISLRSTEPCAALMFDIKSFFSELDHTKLKEAWLRIIGEIDRLPDHHFNVFNAVTNFSYILRDELRVWQTKFTKKPGFNERKLAHIRKYFGKEAFFESLLEFRTAIKNKSIKVYNRPFMKGGKPVGIPQGLPISSVLANIYMMSFDLSVIDKIVTPLNGFYRRYSDDILLICKAQHMAAVEEVVKCEIQKVKLRLSEDKTERFIIKQHSLGKLGQQLVCFQLLDGGEEKIKPLTYLGFQYYGYKIRIKPSNISKFYRRTIDAVKRKTNRIRKLSENQPHIMPAIYVNQIKKLSVSIKENTKIKPTLPKHLIKNEVGEFCYKLGKPLDKPRSNYISYVRRAAKIMNDPLIYEQIKKRRQILHKALNIHYKRRIKKFLI